MFGDMAEIPGARAELDRAGDWLRTQIRELAARLTPERLPELPSRDPIIVDWHEPLGYQHRITARAERAAEPDNTAAAAYAAELLAEAGWEVTQETEQASSAPLLHVIGTRDGFGLRVRFQEGFAEVLYTGETPKMPLYTPEEFVPPPPAQTAETVDPEHVLCYECRGLGWCPVCDGRGWTSGETGRAKCPECFGSRVCPICRGAGELTIAALADWERDQYPELRR